jgi:hypothetical protein
MKIYKSVLFLFLYCFVFANSCGGNVDTPDSFTTKPESFYTVLADENLQESHKVAILQALNEWAEKTNNTLTYKLSFVDMSQEKADASTPHTIKIYVRDPGVGYLGWTSWESRNHSAYTFIRPSIDGELFRRVMLHELGHAFNLHFGDDTHYVGAYESVMHPSIGEASSHLCCPELQAFCNEYGCQVDCMNTVKPKTNPIVNYSWKETELP